MGTIKVILKEDILNLGEAGDIKSVKRGYARNFLFPKNLIMDYSTQNKKMLDAKKDFYEKKKLEKKENAAKLKEKLEQESISITISAGDKGRLFGTVTNTVIAEKLTELNYTMIEKKAIELKEHIKFSGKYKFRIHLYQDIYANMELEVIGKVEKPKTSARPARKQGRRFTPREEMESTDNQQPENQETVAEENLEIKE